MLKEIQLLLYLSHAMESIFNYAQSEATYSGAF
jgi:hypothetical protein